MIIAALPSTGVRLDTDRQLSDASALALHFRTVERSIRRNRGLLADRARGCLR